jgi:hypothetical protein
VRSEGLDLSGVSFDDSILAWSDFTGATLVGDSFNGADLQKTIFVSADLRNSKFLLAGKTGQYDVRWNYVEREMYRTKPSNRGIKGYMGGS